MSELAKKLKELKKTVCKERANARWIERSGVMKKKLASVLKVNKWCIMICSCVLHVQFIVRVYVFDE